MIHTLAALSLLVAPALISNEPVQSLNVNAVAVAAPAIVVPVGPPAAPAPVLFNVFELDRNAVQDGASPPDDWSLLFNGGAETGGHSAAYSGIDADPGQDTIFTGGKKDIQNIGQWGWKNNGGFPDKDDITNAYAAAYQSGSDLIVYFGADRFANTGDAFLGFWFFKNKIALKANGTFDGTHEVGDVLVLVNYPQGSTTGPQIQVLEWNPAQQDVATNLHQLFSGTGALCGDVPPSFVCATTNLSPAPSPWPYVPKAGSAGIFPPESFFEGGINLTQILGNTACFASFMAETRSSTSITATLKDFVLGDFPVCALDVSKSCDVVGLTADFSKFTVTFNATVTNSGAGTYPVGSKLTVTDDAGTPGNAGDDVVITKFLAAPLGPGQTIQVTGQFNSNSNPPFNTVKAKIETTTDTISAEPYGVECDPLVLNPKLDLTKFCSLSLETFNGMLVVRVDFNGTVTNIGDVPLVVKVTDDQAGTVLPNTLLLPGQHADIQGSYYPDAAVGGVTDPCDAMFSDTFTATGTNPLLRDPIVEMITANCPLCGCK